MDLEEFISTNRQTALSIIRKSKYFKKLDYMDIEEIIHCGLWKCYRTYNSKRASLRTYIILVIKSYISNLVRDKPRELVMEFVPEESYEPSRVNEFFTDEEWKIVSPLLICPKTYAYKYTDLTAYTYNKTLQTIKTSVLQRLN